MPARVSTGDRDAVLRQMRWCAAVQTLVNCHYSLLAWREPGRGRRASAVGHALVVSENGPRVKLLNNSNK